MAKVVVLRNRVKELRQQRNLSQTDLARLACVGQTTISSIETGRYVPRVDIAIKVSQALGLAVEDVFILKGDGTSEKQIYKG